MATKAKKKASPAQLAARARFAAAAKAGTLRKGSKLKKNPTRSKPKVAPARKKNPSRGERNAGTVVRTRNPAPKTGTLALPYVIVPARSMVALGHFKTRALAMKFAQAYSDETGKPVRVRVLTRN